MKYVQQFLTATVLTVLASCTQPGETTGIGAAAGGALGAGLGAIVGSQTGSAGTGLAIGAVAGAAGGSLVGNALQAQDEAIRTQDEAIERQEQQLSAHGRRIAEMRGAHDGPALSRRGGSSREVGGLSANRSHALKGGVAMGYSYPGSRLKLSSDQRSRLARGERLESDSARGSYRSPAAERMRVANSNSITHSGGAIPLSSRSDSSSITRELQRSQAMSHPSAAFHSSPPQPRILDQSAADAISQPAVINRAIPEEPALIAPRAEMKARSLERSSLPTTVSRSNTAPAKPAGAASRVVERDLTVAEPSSAHEPAPAVVHSEAAGFKSSSILASPKEPMGTEIIPPAPAELERGTIARQEIGSADEPSTNKKEAVIAQTEPVSAKLNQPKVPASEECQKASTEVEKAGSSSEVADKLFHFRRALRLCPDNAQHHMGLGQVYQSLSRKSDAEFEFREALRLDPSLSEARQSLDKLRY